MIPRRRMTQQMCERGADWVVRSLERESIDFPWEASAALHVSVPIRAVTCRPFMLMRRHATPPDRSLHSVVSTVLGHAFGVTHSRCQRPRINAGMAIGSTSIGNAIGATNFLSSRWKDTRNRFWITCNTQVEGIRCLASNNLYIVQISAIRALYNNFLSKAENSHDCAN